MKNKKNILLLICTLMFSCSGGIDNQKENSDDQIEIPDDQTDDPDDQTDEPDYPVDDPDDQKKEIDSLAFWQLLPTDTITAIKCTVDSIEFKFSLLNENDVSATKFKEGENIIFYFKMTNHRIDELYIDYNIAGLTCSQELGDVKTLDHKTYKYPSFPGRPCFLSSVTLSFYGENNSRELKIPWYYDYEIHGIKPNAHLPRGKYYTQFTHVFNYVLYDDTPILSIGPLTFKIYFEIE